MERLSDYDYELSPERIAQAPLEDRAASKLLHLDRRTGAITHRKFLDIIEVLRPRDLLVLNDTRVTALRLFGKKDTGAQVEILVLNSIEQGVFEALVRPGKRLPAGTSVHLPDGFRAEIGPVTTEPKREVRFTRPDGSPVQALAELNAIGLTPLPPYVHEALADPERYQTVYADTGGSAAAPTAGLHFTSEILAELRAKGIGIAKVTLDVSLDTFRPVDTEDLDAHQMHGERISLSKDTAEAIHACQGRIIAVGTTVVRTLESFAMARRKVEPGQKTTKLFIRENYEFQVVEGLLTNFHLPRTTMLVLVSSFAGRDRVLEAYREALRQDYRFLSFGDAMLVV